jgi:hypothetical protein
MKPGPALPLTAHLPNAFRALPSLGAALLMVLGVVEIGTAQDLGIVHGTVRSESGGVALSGASIEVRSGAWNGRVAADEVGRYRITDVPAGRSMLVVRHIGHHPLELEILVPSGREVVLDLSLPVRPIALAPVEVQSGIPGLTAEVEAAPRADLGLAGILALGTAPGLSEIGLGDAVRGLPENEPADHTSVLYVRGAAADLKLVYLDGAPVYAPFPLGGLLEPFSPGVLLDADVYLGGAPARYDGGLSYVMDLRTRAGEASGVQTSGALDMLSGRVIVEGGLPERASFIATGRAIHPLAEQGIFGSSLPYGYREGMLRSDLKLGQRSVLSVTGFANSESVRLADVTGASDEISWGNAAGSLRFRGMLGETLAEVTASTGAYSAQLPLTGTSPLLAAGSARRSRFSADMAGRREGMQIRYGASVDHQQYQASARVVESGVESAQSESAGVVAGLYGEAMSRIGDRFRLRGGMRLDQFSGNGFAWAPRFAATWLLTERAALTVAAGRYHQFLRPADENILRHPAAGALIPTGLTLGRSAHFAVGLDQDLGEGIRLGLEGYYKDFSDVPGVYVPEANASGVDFWVRRNTGQWTGWIGYSLAWAWSPLVGGQQSFTGRHLLSSAVSLPTSRRTKLDLQLAYGAGLPYAGIPLHSTPNVPERDSFRLSPGLASAVRGGTETAPLLQPPTEPYLRVDAALSGHFAPRRGTRTFAVSPYLRLLNSFGSRDALFYYFDSGNSNGIRAIGTLPVVPIAGVEWKF